MASICRRNGRWIAQVRRKGFPARSRTFDSKVAAQAWASLEEGRIESAESPSPLHALKTVTLGDILDRYIAEITPTKRGAEQEAPRLRKMRRDKIAGLDLASLGANHLAEYRDRRLRKVKPGTIRRELSYIHHALDIASKEWGYRLHYNPVKDVRLPPLHNARNRRLQPGELQKLEQAIATCRNPHIGPVVHFAIETAMRRGEILALRWADVDLERRIAFVRIS